MKQVNIITRPDGSQVKIVAELCSSPSFNHSISNYVFHRIDNSSQWRLCKSSPDSSWLNMSVDEYVKRGRSEMLQVVSPHEIIKTNMQLMSRVRF